jgi:phosphate starvation-inducible PhoH-like protein
LSVRVGGRGAELIVEGDEADVVIVERILKDYTQLFTEGRTPSSSEMREAFRQIADDRASSLRELLTGQKRINPSGRKQVTAKGPNQRRYLEAIEDHDIVFGIGPAGTGKTFLAVAMGIQFLLAKRVNRIVLARPAVEAGEKLGFLPGDLQEKVDPYLRPLYDSLFDLLDAEKATRFLEKRVIEVAPLAFMRGRTLADSFVILDEAQNTTSEQMKMFLTRIGFGSKAVITGDVTQIDLPSGRKSGLVEAQRVVSGIEGIAFVQFDERDVVRHQLVQMIIKAYDEHNRKISL